MALELFAAFLCFLSFSVLSSCSATFFMISNSLSFSFSLQNIIGPVLPGYLTLLRKILFYLKERRRKVKES
jgi:hypothetical protein